MKKSLKALPRNANAKDNFKLYITERTIYHYVTQTNVYAEQFIQIEHGRLRPHSLVHEWLPTDRAEMITLIAFLILMGIVNKPRMSRYWSTYNLLATLVFNQVMRRIDVYS